MRTYARAWRILWSVMAVAGVGLAVLESSALGVLLTFGLLFGLCWLLRNLRPRVLPSLRPLNVAVGALTVWAYCWILPALGLLVVLTAGLSSPRVIGRAVQSARRPSTPAVEKEPAPRVQQPPTLGVDLGFVKDLELTGPEALGPLQGLDDRQLCRLWRQSFWVLRQPPPPGTALRLVALREACLDELERRDASALHAWLGNGARASGGPEKYLTHPPPRRDPDAG
jgi:hypothetical protein